MGNERFYRVKSIRANREYYFSDRHGNTFLRPAGATYKANRCQDTDDCKTIIEVIEPAVVKTYTLEEWENRDKKETP